MQEKRNIAYSMSEITAYDDSLGMWYFSEKRNVKQLSSVVLNARD